MSEEQVGGFIVIPDEVLSDTRVSMLGKLIYGEIFRMANAATLQDESLEVKINLNSEVLGIKYGVAKEVVDKVLEELAEIGYISNLEGLNGQRI